MKRETEGEKKIDRQKQIEVKRWKESGMGERGGELRGRE
jgi:hypothetical protein